MKNKIKYFNFILIMIATSIFTINVQAKANVISGTGKNIGDEICIEDECFYVIENNGKEVKLFAKYNLYAGVNLYAVDVDPNLTYAEQTEYLKPYAEKYDGYYKDYYNETGKRYKVVYYDYIEDKAKQRKDAVSIHSDSEGKVAYPEIGSINVMDFVPDWIWDDIPNDIYIYGEGEYLDFSMKDSYSYDYLLEYQDNLTDLGVTPVDVSILAVSELSDLVERITGKNLPLAEWYENWEDASNGEQFYLVGNIKELLPSGYEWIYSTTYWTRTTTVKYPSFMYFVYDQGSLCATDWCYSTTRAGLRPVVTISTEDLNYKIETKTDGNGTLKSSKQTSKSGEEITFTVTPKKGYVLGVVKVTDAEGNVVYFEDNKFTMPSSNVLIEATFITENPETSSVSIIISIVLMIIGGICILINYKKLKWLN